MQTLRETVFTPESLIPLAIGVGGGIAAGYGQDGALIGTVSSHANALATECCLDMPP